MTYNLYKSTTTDNNPYKIQTEYYKTLVRQHEPYKYLLTLTFSHKYTSLMTCQFTSQVIYRMNSKIFGRNYLKYDDRCMDGFVFFEKHMSEKVRNPFHLHMLIKQNERYDKFNIDQMNEILDCSTERILDGKDRKVFTSKCINTTEIYDDEGSIRYCFEQIYDRNLDRLKFIDKNGLSDNSDVGVINY